MEPSRRFVEKIIPTLNIPEEEKGKITEEIKKKKKTSEGIELISENVKVRYVDEQAFAIIEKWYCGIGKKESDGLHYHNKKTDWCQLYNVSDKKLSSNSYWRKILYF